MKMNQIIECLKVFQNLKNNNNHLDQIKCKIESFSDQLKYDANFDFSLNSMKMCKTIDRFNECENNKLFKCFWPKCKYTAVLRTHLNEHISIHSNPNERPFICDVKYCNKKFKTKRDLYKHKYRHQRSLNNKCQDNNECNQTSSQLSNIKSNIKTQKRFKCDFNSCEKSFHWFSDLNVHKLRHSRQKSFKCDFDLCEKTFIRNYDLNLHKRTHSRIF